MWVNFLISSAHLHTRMQMAYDTCRWADGTEPTAAQFVSNGSFVDRLLALGTVVHITGSLKKQQLKTYFVATKLERAPSAAE